MYKDYRYINAGTNEFYRYGKKARAYVEACLEPKNGYYSIAADGDNYWTFGTSEGQFGEFAKFEDVCFSVNKAGYIWAKEGTDKATAFVKMIKKMLSDMIATDNARFASCEE